MARFPNVCRVLTFAAFASASLVVSPVGPTTAVASVRSAFFVPSGQFTSPEPVIRVQSDGDEGTGKDEMGGGGGSTPDTPPLINGSGISSALQEVTTLCRNLGDSGYSISCLAAAYEDVARRIPQYGDMAQVRETLLDTSKKLRALVAANQDTKKPPLRVSTRGKKPLKLSRSLRAVREDAMPKVARQAEVIINGGASVLLRATGDSDRIRAQYQQVARSMQTGAIMLRSL
jgi:hypothetical protein